jgi:GNAT superfamily N-acetyltransferase
MSASEPRVWIASGEEDLDAAAALLGEFRDWFGKSEPTDVQVRAGVARIQEAGEGEYLLAAREGEPEGVCQLRYRWSVWTSSHDAWLEDLFVRESARGSGLGRLLLEAAVEHARARGCARIELDVDEGNEPALALYRANGFSGDAKAEIRSLLLGRPLVPVDEPAA